MLPVRDKFDGNFRDGSFRGRNSTIYVTFGGFKGAGIYFCDFHFCQKNI